METRKMKRSENTGHILYPRVCDFCSREYWAKKIDGKCCSNKCRNLKMMRKKNKN